MSVLETTFDPDDDPSFTIRSRKVSHALLLTPAFRDQAFFRDLFFAWDAVAHNMVTEPRRELGRLRSFFRRDVGDYFILNADTLGTASITARVSDIELTDRNLPSLITASALSELAEDPKDSPQDTIEIYWETKDQTGQRTRVFANIVDRARISRTYLVKNAMMLGFEFLSDELTTEGYWRLAQFTSLYWSESSTYAGINFLGWVLGGRLKVEPLWTTDGANFTRYSVIKSQRFRTVKSTYVSGSDVYFPSTRVMLLYDAEANPYIDLNKLRDFFLFQAPLNVVLHEIASMPIEFERNVPTILGTQYVSTFSFKAE